jgi:hypothetical protein
MGAAMNTQKKATGRLNAVLAKEMACAVKHGKRNAAPSFILPIDNCYRLTADEHAWHIEHRKGTGGEWRPVEWHSTIHAAVSGPKANTNLGSSKPGPICLVCRGSSLSPAYAGSGPILQAGGEL